VKFCTLIFILLGLVACDNSLVVSDELTKEQRKAWREMLVFPSHCENGFYEFDDDEAPILEFSPITKTKTLVYNVCERYAYQDRINIFIYDATVNKATLLEFPIAKLDESSVTYLDEEGNTLKEPKGKFNLIFSTLIQQRGTEVLNEDEIVVTRHYSGAGNCGTWTKYSIANNKPKIITLRAMFTCEMDSDDEAKWPEYRVKCKNKLDAKTCIIVRR